MNKRSAKTSNLGIDNEFRSKNKYCVRNYLIF